jgi:hypothetical protein
MTLAASHPRHAAIATADVVVVGHPPVGPRRRGRDPSISPGRRCHAAPSSPLSLAPADQHLCRARDAAVTGLLLESCPDGAQGQQGRAVASSRLERSRLVDSGTSSRAGSLRLRHCQGHHARRGSVRASECDLGQTRSCHVLCRKHARPAIVVRPFDCVRLGLVDVFLRG